MTVWKVVEDVYADRRSKDDCSRLGLGFGWPFGSGKEGIKLGCGQGRSSVMTRTKKVDEASISKVLWGV